MKVSTVMRIVRRNTWFMILKGVHGRLLEPTFTTHNDHVLITTSLPKIALSCVSLDNLHRPRFH